MTGFLSRMLPACALLCAMAAPAQKMMPKDAQPHLEVATVKPTPIDEHKQGFDADGSHIKLIRQTVQSMIMFAYGVHGKQIVDAPEWVGKEAFDCEGVPDVTGEPNLQQFQQLVRQLLADRFGLKTHRAKRDLSYYALRIAPGGSKLAKSTLPEDASPDQGGDGGANGMTMKFTNNNLDDFGLGMQYFTDRPIVNETSLTGRYDFNLQWMPDEMKVTEGSAPGLFTALREQLGLEFKAARGPVETFVVDHIEKPGEN